MHSLTDLPILICLMFMMLYTRNKVLNISKILERV